MMTLAVTGAPDSHRALVFWRAQMVTGAPTALMCFFVGFRTDFVTSVRVSVASAGVLALAGLRPAGARKPQGGPSAPPPLDYVPGSLALPARIARIASNQIAVNSHNTCLPTACNAAANMKEQLYN